MFFFSSVCTSASPKIERRNFQAQQVEKVFGHFRYVPFPPPPKLSYSSCFSPTTFIPTGQLRLGTSQRAGTRIVRKLILPFYFIFFSVLTRQQKYILRPTCGSLRKLINLKTEGKKTFLLDDQITYTVGEKEWVRRSQYFMVQSLKRHHTPFKTNSN